MNAASPASPRGLPAEGPETLLRQQGLVTAPAPDAARWGAALPTAQQRVVAAALGTAVRRVHEGADPAGHPALTVPDLAAGVARSSLPAVLRPEVADYVARWADPSPVVVVHGDLRPAHVWVTDGELAGISGWSGAVVADRTFELATVFFALCGGGASVLRSFLEAYDWPVTAALADRVLAAALRRQALGAAADPAYDLFGSLPTLVDLDAVTSLDELADLLLGPIVRTADRFRHW
jgi:hypothetical protein